MGMNLQELKRLDFQEIAGLFGYQVDTRESSPRGLVLRRGADNGKLLAKREGDRWLYCSCRDAGDNGSVLDFVMRRTGGTLREAADWLERLDPLPSHTAVLPSPEPPDRLRLERIWRACIAESRNGWLDSRGIPASVQAADVFRGTWRTTREGGAAFAYRDFSGLVGIEIRGAGCKRFIQGSQRALWCSRNANEAGTVLLTESPLDAMAHYALYRMNHAYIAFGGAVSSLQLELLREKLDRPGLRIIAGFDNDEAGENYTAIIGKSLTVDRSRPIGKDWLDDLNYVQRENGNDDYEIA